MQKKVIFKTSGIFYRDTHYAHVSFLIDIDKEYRRIRIVFKYSPVVCEVPDEAQKQEMRCALAEQIFRTDEPYVTDCIERVYPVKNEISVAVRNPNRWLGEHHCFVDGRDEIVLGESATYGFFQEPNIPGQYEFVLHVFSIYTPECSYTLEILGEDEE